MVEVKKEIKKYERGMQVADFPRFCKKSTSSSRLQRRRNEIREMCKMWQTAQNFVEKHHPNKAVAVLARNLFNDNATSHFCKILKRRQKQVSLERFLAKGA